MDTRATCCWVVVWNHFLVWQVVTILFCWVPLTFLVVEDVNLSGDSRSCQLSSPVNRIGDCKIFTGLAPKRLSRPNHHLPSPRHPRTGSTQQATSSHTPKTKQIPQFISQSSLVPFSLSSPTSTHNHARQFFRFRIRAHRTFTFIINRASHTAHRRAHEAATTTAEEQFTVLTSSSKSALETYISIQTDWSTSRTTHTLEGLTGHAYQSFFQSPYQKSFHHKSHTIFTRNNNVQIEKEH